MMRILLVAPEFPPATGGMAAHAGRMAALLAARGHTVRVLTMRENAPRTHDSSYHVTAGLTEHYAADMRRIRAEITASEPQVVLLANAGFARLALYPGPPIVTRTVGNDVYGAWIGPHVPLRFLYWRLPHSPGSLGARLRRLDQERRAAAVLEGVQHCAAVLCNSSYTRARLGQLGVPEQALHVVAGGVDTTIFCPNGRPAALSDTIVLGTAGGIRPIKGFSVAIEALAQLAARRHNLSLVIAGGELDAHRAESAHVRAQAAALGVASRVTFLGNVPQDQMPDFYRRVSLYLQPSVPYREPASDVVQEESMGRALCEAQASGLPVIASRCGGVPEVVQEGRTGLLVPPGDAHALADAIERLLGQPELAQRMATAGRTWVVERFSWDAVVSATEALLERAIRLACHEH